MAAQQVVLKPFWWWGTVAQLAHKTSVDTRGCWARTANKTNSKRPTERRERRKGEEMERGEHGKGAWPNKSHRTVVQATWRAVNQAGVEALERLLAHFLDANPNLRPFFITGTVIYLSIFI